jgi:excisionase family DNA binding protein
LTVGEVAHYLRIPEETVYKYARSGRIPASKLGKHWRFIRVEIDHWVAEQRGQFKRPFRVLVVDGESDVRRLFARWLSSAGCAATTAESGEAALSLIRQDPAYDLITLDLRTPGLNGAETLRQVKALTPGTLIAIITTEFDNPLMDEALACGPFLVVRKPLSRASFLKMIKHLIAGGRGC